MCVSIHKCCYCIEYAQVLKMLGNGRLEAYCFDGSNRLCHIRGKLRKKVSRKGLKMSSSVRVKIIRVIKVVLELVVH